MTVKELRKMMEEIRGFMTEQFPEATDLNISVTSSGHMHVSIMGWDKAELTDDYSKVKRREFLSMFTFGDGWFTENSEETNMRYKNEGILREVV